MKAIIIGGGIAGLSTSLALHKKGIQTEVYESAPTLKPAGAGILLAPNGMEVLKRLDNNLFTAITKKANTIEQTCIENHKGKPLAVSSRQSMRHLVGMCSTMC